jgi:hypothetical protein
VAVLDFSTTESREESLRQSFTAGIEGYDLIFVQPYGLSYTRPRDLHARVKGSSVVVRIFSFYFRGLHPDLCYVGAFGKRAGWTDYNSLICLNRYKNGLQPFEILHQLDEGSA